jgi:hypothetical protein
LGLSYGSSSVVIGVRFIFGAIVGNGSNDFFGIVATSEGALGVSPIALGLTLVIVGHHTRSPVVVAQAPRGLRRIVADGECTPRVDNVALVSRLDDEFVGEFAVGESGQTENACRIGCRDVSAKLVGQTAEQKLRFVLAESTYIPHNLMPARRSVEDEIGSWNIRRPSNRVERGIAVSVEVEVNVANITDVVLGSAMRIVSEGIHSYEDIGPAGILSREPRLKIAFGDCFGRRDALDRLAGRAITDDNRGSVGGLEELQHVLRSAERSRLKVFTVQG